MTMFGLTIDLTSLLIGIAAGMVLAAVLFTSIGINLNQPVKIPEAGVNRPASTPDWPEHATTDQN